MIPIRLSLHNFMCYRDKVPPLSFEGIHTACISGDNGNGKSALIDAMTWALWGKSRAKSDDDLVYLSQTEMEVEFDFSVSGQPYRIIRKRSKPKRYGGAGKSILELQIATPEGFRAITGNTLSQTQQKIIAILRLDYPTFVNSALLLQGRADEFTIKRPVDRKQVLADILGLSFYDRLEERAKERAREQELETIRLGNIVRDIDAELAQKPAYQTELEAVQNQLGEISRTVVEQETSLNRLRQQRQSLENLKPQLVQLEERLTKTTSDLKRWDDQLNQHRARIKGYQEVIAQASTIESGFTQFSQANRLNDQLNQQLRQVNTLRQRQYQLEQSINQASQSLLREHAVVQSRISQLETSLQQLPSLNEELRQTRVELEQLAPLEEELSRKQQTSKQTQSQINSLEIAEAQLRREIRELGEKLDLLQTKHGTRCPLCETELAAEGVKIIETKYTTDQADKAGTLKIIQTELAQKKTQFGQREREISQFETRLNQSRTSLQARASLLSQQIAKMEQDRHQLTETRNQLAEIEQHLAQRDFAAAEQQALSQLEEELAKLAYNPDQHDEARQRLTHFEPYAGLKRQLDEANRLISQAREGAAQADEASQELRHRLEETNQQRQGLTSKLSHLPQLINELTQAEGEHQRLINQQQQAQQALGKVNGRLEHCSELEAKRRVAQKQLSQAQDEEKIYRDLAQAFGKKGIQALIIETALPEIETEADKLLARMTDNRMHLKIETQRETKSGKIAETLDIKIADELGTRNYEMFSGGEAFRINFAIRIALSKLLARRAGAPLPTLIIDEGFGTQDNAGIGKLKEAINSIQDDFDKILVITHIEELRDAFPTRIDVIKTDNGSTIEVS
ncbi:MAG: SMC family ATPase [Dehalococcoidales bacterium]|nr:SMC family ATPase [Dehalococcoidales bacterium]